MVFSHKKTQSQLLRTIASLSRLSTENSGKQSEKILSGVKYSSIKKFRALKENENLPEIAIKQTVSTRDKIIANLRQSIRELNEKNQKIITQMETEEQLFNLNEKK